MDAAAVRARLEQLLAVQNTYLSTFQSLGALGLLLGTFGLAAVLRSTVSLPMAVLASVVVGALAGFYGGRVVVESGLAPGDEVIVVGQTNVTEGDAVVIDSSAVSD